MAFLFQRTKPARPTPVPTDSVVPMHLFDDNSINRSVLLYVTLRFDAVLDAERLRRALERLMELGDWRKLGARLRTADKGGGLEYHVPASFDAARPGFVFSHARHDMAIADHPQAGLLPRPTAHTAVYHGLDGLADLARRPDGPRKLTDFLTSDEPQLSLHVVSFTDATLVSLSWLHTFMDAVAMSTVLRAWVAVLDGREDAVPPIANFATDPLATLGTAPTEPHVLAPRQLAGLNMALFGLRYMWDLLWYRDSQRTIYLPAARLAALKQSALADLAAGEKAGTDVEAAPFLSDGDVLCAFLTRLAVRNDGPASTRLVGMLNPMDVRPVLAATALPPAAGVCLCNAVFVITAFASAGDILTRPLGWVASLVRRSIVEQGTAAQMDALAALTRRAVAQTGRPPVFGDGGTRLVIFSNWTKAGLFEVDFGAAVVGGEKRGTKPSFVNTTGESDGLSPRGSWPILGREQSGGYWIQGNLRSDLWEAVEKDLKER